MEMFDVVGDDWSMLVGGVVVWDWCVRGTRWSTHDFATSSATRLSVAVCVLARRMSDYCTRSPPRPATGVIASRRPATS